MKRMSLVVAVLVFVSVLFVGSSFLPEARATTRYVGGTDSGNYTTIQGAMDDANPGDTIYVYSGVYYENVRITKTLSLYGEDREGTIIDGGGTGFVIWAYADWVNITDLTLVNSRLGLLEAGIILDTVKNCHIANNSVSRNQDGILLVHSNNNTIVNNTAHGNNVSGIHLILSYRNTITSNSVASNERSGIFLASSDSNTVSDNIASSNKVHGIYIGSSSNNNIWRNTVSNNKHGVYLASAHHNKIYHNDFIGNTQQAYDTEQVSNGNHTNQWDDGYPSGGNSWSNHACVDEKSGPNQDQPNSDGICDTAYEISGGANKDRYPLLCQPPPKMQESVFEQAWFWIAVAVVIVVILLVLLVLVRMRRKKRESEPPGG